MLQNDFQARMNDNETLAYSTLDEFYLDKKICKWASKIFPFIFKQCFAQSSIDTTWWYPKMYQAKIVQNTFEKMNGL